MNERSRAKRPKNDEKKRQDQLKREEKRKAGRLKEDHEITITIVSEIKNPPKEKILFNYSKDISMSGAKIQGNILLPVDTIVKIDLTLRDMKQKITAFGKVRWNKIIIENESYEAGVEFVNTPGDAIKKLEDYVSCKQKFISLNPVGMPFWIFARFNSVKQK
jgi:hypothetical protein